MGRKNARVTLGAVMCERMNPDGGMAKGHDSLAVSPTRGRPDFVAWSTHHRSSTAAVIVEHVFLVIGEAFLQ